jgi:LPXTG-site transpeptidase (sortase) family protein
VIPRIDLDEIVLEGIETEDLNAGPGHLPGSVLPGERGNSIVSAHRDRHFNHFDALKVGDTVVTESSIGKTTWVIVSQRVVDKDARALVRTSGHDAHAHDLLADSLCRLSAVAADRHGEAREARRGARRIGELSQ